VPDGFAFVDEAELPGLAAELDLELDTFKARHLRSVVDPRTAEPRLALRDRPDGACGLLDGDNQCTAYAARPKGCRDFPLWPSILSDQQGLERATRLCPGIEERPTGAAREAALAALARLLAQAPPPEICAFPAGAGSGPEVTGLELELLLAAGGDASPSCPLASAPAPDGTTRCSTPAAAPLACRAQAFRSSSGCGPAAADPDLESLATECDALESSLPWPRRRGPLFELLHTRSDPARIELLFETHP
jgi:Fe-S-cluster containining protein